MILAQREVCSPAQKAYFGGSEWKRSEQQLGHSVSPRMRLGACPSPGWAWEHRELLALLEITCLPHPRGASGVLEHSARRHPQQQAGCWGRESLLGCRTRLLLVRYSPSVLAHVPGKRDPPAGLQTEVDKLASGAAPLLPGVRACLHSHPISGMPILLQSF